ncbi:hypothetical protein [Pseudohaliea rubra]|uniref:hypothetical protein n=1 Tax=Pseudohaliea rubra TaxID=475795 RepID=UPI00069134D9|nr:hypothetical protein [Pseudohaliea rubra]
MIGGLILVLGVALIAYFYWRPGARRGRHEATRLSKGAARRAESNRHSAKHDTASGASPYAAVSIVAAPGSCSAAKAVQGKRFLATEGVTLPLEDCSLTRCHCFMKKHRERRQSDSERRLAQGLKSELYKLNGEPERRAGPRGRRSTDRR